MRFQSETGAPFSNLFGRVWTKPNYRIERISMSFYRLRNKFVPMDFLHSIPKRGKKNSRTRLLPDNIDSY